jgi:hypothetical protein
MRLTRQAGEITTKALRTGIDALHEGMSDRELASILIGTAIREGKRAHVRRAVCDIRAAQLPCPQLAGWERQSSGEISSTRRWQP